MPVVVPIRILQGLLYVVGAYFVRFIRVYHSQNSLSASRSVQEIPASLRNYCSNGVAVRFR